MSPPRFIYFDLGNVLLKFDHDIACGRFSQRTGLAPEVFQAALFESGLQHQYELGAISSEEFAAGVNQQTRTSLSTRVILELCSDIFSLNASVIPVVTQLKSAGYSLGILSNTCSAHWEFIEAHSYTALKELFSIHVLSFREQVMKPDARIYHAAANAVEVPIQDILFIDDRSENVAGARETGMDAIQFQDVSTLIRDLVARDIRTNL